MRALAGYHKAHTKLDNDRLSRILDSTLRAMIDARRLAVAPPERLRRDIDRTEAAS